MHQIAEDRGLDEELVLGAAAVGRRGELAQGEPEAVAAEADRPPPRLHEIRQVDQELRRRRQLGAEVGEHRREHRDDENQQHVHQRDRQADDRDRVGHGRLHLLRQLDRRFEVAGHLLENFREAAGRFAGLHHGAEQRVEGIRKFPDRGRKGITLRDVAAHIANHDAEARVFRLVLQCLEALHERQAGGQQRRDLLREQRELAERELVGLRLFLERLLLRERLCRHHAAALLLGSRTRALSLAGSGRREQCHGAEENTRPVGSQPPFHSWTGKNPVRNT